MIDQEEYYLIDQEEYYLIDQEEYYLIDQEEYYFYFLRDKPYYLIIIQYCKGLFNNYVTLSCLYAKFRWLIFHVQLSFQLS